ncbi:Mur ligase family, catalytic domain [Musa troglodytarum]|uniref:Mur ligase family, catalytic domain n=1 Tax=Musa troglodytarum TaxID=320322 RepID=A0A9E7EXR1_9LILI|nr:Mur ligase family, catalytic domain [Musa troglodytarum]
MESITSPVLPLIRWPERGLRERSLCLVLPSRIGGRVGLRARQWSSVPRRGTDLVAFSSTDEGQDEEQEWIHFVGIGGAGLSALAMLALKQGFEVSGSDIMWSSYMDNLHNSGARLFIGHSMSNIEKNDGLSLPNAIVISSAIPADNEEIAHAMSVGVPIYKRDHWLRRITEKFNLIAISGTHGKSTTAAMLSYVMHAMGDNLVAVIGANVPQFSGSIIPGKGPNFVLEADEYDNCFLGLSPDIAVVTNVELDHVDIFQDEEAVLKSFKKFVKQIKAGGHLILCGDSAGACALLSEQMQEAVASNCILATSAMSSHGCTVTTYGLSTDNDWSASSITPNLLGGQDYMLVIATMVTLVNGKNSIHEAIRFVRNHLSKFEGVSRRFELIAQEKFLKQAIWVVFQPHTFSRLSAFMDDYSTAFKDADHVVITKVYSARERNIWNTDGEALANVIGGRSTEYIHELVYSARERNIWNTDGEALANVIGGRSTEYIHELDDVVEKLALAISSYEDREIIVFTLGAGDITSLGPQLLRRLERVKRI